MKFLSNKITVFMVIVQLIALLFINVKHFLNDYYDLNYGRDHNKLLIGERIASSPILKFYSAYSGTNSSYGFFGPNVGSDFPLSFWVYDEDCNLLSIKTRPHLEQTESKMRFALCTLPIGDKIGVTTSNYILNRYIEIMLHQIATDVRSEFANGKYVEAKVYATDYPKIQEFLSGKEEKLILIDKYSFNF